MDHGSYKANGILVCTTTVFPEP